MRVAPKSSFGQDCCVLEPENVPFFKYIYAPLELKVLMYKKYLEVYDLILKVPKPLKN